MKVNGYTLRTAIRNRETERDATITALNNALTSGEGGTPEDLLNKIEQCERDIAKLQAFQARYNLQVTVEINEEKVSMAEAVKRIGGIERVSAHWKNLTNKVPSGIALQTARVDSELAITKSKQYATEASTLRGRMSAANAIEIDMPELEESLMG